MNISNETLTTLVDEIARLKTRVQEQNERIEWLLQDNADLRDALQLVKWLEASVMIAKSH